MAKLLTRIGFIDETSVKTNMAKTTGWAPRGQRLIDHAPFGSWQTQTFIAALRHDRLDAPWVIDGPINRIRHAARTSGAAWLILRPLHRDPTRPHPAAGRRDYSGQPLGPQKPKGGPDPAQDRLLVPATAAILSRPLRR
jgi:hypothetical protein